MTCCRAVSTFFITCASFLAIATIITHIPHPTLPRFAHQKQIEFTEKGTNLRMNGSVQYEGWARSSIWRYVRGYVHASPLRIKEWDYYSTYIQPLNLFICTTIADLGYAGLYSLAVVDMNEKKFVQKDDIRLFPFGLIGLPPTTHHDYSINRRTFGLNLTFEKHHYSRSIRVSSKRLVLPNGQQGFHADLRMYNPNGNESMNIQTTWAENRNLFYLNEKINGMPTHGTIQMGNETYNITDDTHTVLDFGRGVWPYSSTWYWGSATTVISGARVGFNLGYGFSDRSVATENCIFYNGRIHKLNNIEFHIPNDPMTKWDITSDDGRFNATFTPIVDRYSNTNIVLFISNQHQYFGNYTGKFKLDNGKIIEFSNVTGFAEKVYSRW